MIRSDGLCVCCFMRLGGTKHLLHKKIVRLILTPIEIICPLPDFSAADTWKPTDA